MNFTKQILASCFAFGLLMACIPQSMAETTASAGGVGAMSIAVIDANRVAQESIAGKDLDKKLKAARESLKKEGETAEKELREKEGAILKELKTMDPKKPEDRKIAEQKKKELEGDVQKKRKGFIQKGADLRNAEIASMKALQGEIARAAAGIADEKKIHIVLDRQAVLIAVQGLDISADVIKRLDETTKSVPFKVGK